MVNSKKFKKLIAFISAVCMTSVCMLSVSADTVADNTQSIVQQDETTTIENELLDLGFSQEEVNLIIENVDNETIQSVLNYTGEESLNARGTVTTDVYHLQDSNGKNISTYTNVKGYNTEGTCASLASAIMFKYYKDYKGYNIPNCTTANFKNFYYSIMPYIEMNNSRATRFKLITSGLTDFCNDNNISLKPCDIEYNVNDSTTSIRKIVLLCITYLRVNEPIMATGSYSTSGGHAVVIQGMVVHRNINNELIGATIEVNNGWGSVDKLDLEEFLTKNTILAQMGTGIVYFL